MALPRIPSVVRGSADDRRARVCYGRDGNMAGACGREAIMESPVKALTAFPSVLANIDKNVFWISSLGVKEEVLHILRTCEFVGAPHLCNQEITNLIHNHTSLAQVLALDGSQGSFRRPGISSPFIQSNYKREQASLNGKRGSRGSGEFGSPYPRLQRKFDLT